MFLFPSVYYDVRLGMENKKINLTQENVPKIALSRRSFLSSSVALAATTAIGMHAGSVLAGEPSVNIDIPKIARLVTGKQFDDALALRAFKALSDDNAGFLHSLTQLSEYIRKNNVTNIEELKSLPDFNGDVKTTTQRIISALYLGYVGEPKSHAAHDDVKFITYTEAQTFTLTKKYTPIPSYSRLQSGYWENLPK